MSRICEVSFTDTRGMRHSVEVSASSLYEAAVLALRAFRRSALADIEPGSASRLVVESRAETERHEVGVRQVEDWLKSQGRTPREQALKVRLREAGAASLESR